MYSPAARLADPATKLKGMFARTVCAAPQFTARVNIAPHASNRIAAPVFITASSRTRRTKEAIRLPALRQNRHWVIWGAQVIEHMGESSVSERFSSRQMRSGVAPAPYPMG